jgi:hypothetical protein
MKEYRVVWHRFPRAYNSPGVLFILAEDEENAKNVAIDYVERKLGHVREDFEIKECHEVTKKAKGLVLE